jgi:hypothetical protein
VPEPDAWANGVKLVCVEQSRRSGCDGCQLGAVLAVLIADRAATVFDHDWVVAVELGAVLPAVYGAHPRRHAVTVITALDRAAEVATGVVLLARRSYRSQRVGARRLRDHTGCTAIPLQMHLVGAIQRRATLRRVESGPASAVKGDACVGTGGPRCAVFI